MRNLEQLENFKELESLDADHNELRNINLKDLHGLKMLSVGHNDLDNLEGLPKNLQYLNASSNKFTSLKGLQGSPDLRVLILNNSIMRDLSHVRFLKYLLYLDVSSSNLTDMEIDDVDSQLLLYLDASNNLFRIIPYIQNPCLYELRLNSNMIQQLSRTKWLFNLRVLDISNNQIFEVTPLAMCPFLRELYITNNLIRDFSNIYSLSVAQNLQILDISGNPVNENYQIYKTIGTLFPEMKVWIFN
jgi:Leucine-rich repeat (LRR) protein